MPDTIYQYHKDGFSISTDRRRLDLDTIHGFLYHCYWCPGIPKEVVQTAIENSLCFGLYQGHRQIGFARAITDYARYAYLADVFVLKPYRSQGLGKWLVACVVACPALQVMSAISLGTRDAHELYKQFGFETLQNSQSQMRRITQMPWYQPNLVKE